MIDWMIRSLHELRDIKREVRSGRWLTWFRQRRRYGFDDRELWNLDVTIAEFALPRLRRFRECSPVVPEGLTEKEWRAILDDMIYALDAIVEDVRGEPRDPQRVDRGMEAFAEYLWKLWW